MMRISQLNLLIALEKYGSFSKTAKELFISQPYISANVKELENELGFRLLDRTNKGVSFTLQGEVVLEKARAIVGEMDAIYQLRSDAANKGLVHRLRVVGAPFFCNTILRDTLAMMTCEIEDFEFDLRHANGGDITKLFSLVEADVGLVLIGDNNEIGFMGEIQKNDLKYFTLYTAALGHIVRRDHPLCLLPEVRLADILTYPQVFQYTSLLDFSLSDYKRHGYTAKPMIIENIAVLLKYISVSNAVTPFIEQVLRTSSYEASELTVLYPVDYAMECKILCVYTKGMATFVENHFLAALAEVCRPYKA